jgi:hypothetical protein
VLPDEWNQYDDEDNPATYAFFNSSSKEWRGNLRITHQVWQKRGGVAGNAAEVLIEGRRAKMEGAKKMKLGEFDCTYYKEYVKQDGDELVVYWWMTGSGSDTFICSFTILKSQEESDTDKVELGTVEGILGSIRLRPAPWYHRFTRRQN